MTKWLLVIFLLAGAFGLLLIRVKEPVPITPSEVPINAEISPTPLIVPNGEVIEVRFNNTDYQLVIVPIKKEDRLVLVPNFSESKDAEELRE